MKAGWIAATVFLTAAGMGWAQEETGIAFEVTTDFYSKYVWRGQNLVDDWVWQPGISASYQGFTAGLWGSLDLTHENGQSGEFTEYDFYGDYSVDLCEGIGASVGYINYKFPSGGTTQEIYGGLSFDTLLSPSVALYYDFEDINGTYITAGIGHSAEEIAKISEEIPVGLDISLSIGWGDSNYNEGYWEKEDGNALHESGFNDLTLSIGFPMEIAGWSVTPSLNYVTLLDSNIRKALASGDKDMFFTGISLGKSF